MRTLLLHDIVADHAVAEVLDAAGHDILRCSEPGQPRFPCAGIDGACPLDGSVDVAVVVHDRPTTSVVPGEVGVVCALRDGIPLVIAGNHTPGPFQGQSDAVATCTEDVPAACQRAVDVAAGRAAEYVGAFCGAPATVHRRGHAVTVRLSGAASGREAVLAHQAAKRLFPAARTIDVATS